jgi:hypothetical protein
MPGQVSRAEDGVMEMAAADVLLDPAFTVPAAPEAVAGVGWVRCRVPRFCEGEAHARRRALTERVIARIGHPPRSSSPTAALLAAMGLAPALETDVAAVALAYQPHTPASPEADAAADRLVAACGGRTEESAARVCVLVQAHAATLALIARRRAGDGAPLSRRRAGSPRTGARSWSTWPRRRSGPGATPAPARPWPCTWPTRTRPARTRPARAPVSQAQSPIRCSCPRGQPPLVQSPGSREVTYRRKTL